MEFERQTVVVVDTDRLLLPDANALLQHDDVRDAATTLVDDRPPAMLRMTDGAGNAITPAPAQFLPWTVERILAAAVESVRRTQSFALDGALLERLFVEYAFGRTDASYREVVVPTFGLHLDEAAVPLDDAADSALVVRRLTADERTTLWNTSALASWMEPLDFAYCDSVVVAAYERPGDAESHEGEVGARTRVVRVLSALRLLAEGDVRMPVFLDRTAGAWEREGAASSLRDWGRFGLRVGRPMWLDAAAASELRDLFALLTMHEALPAARRLDIALRRFDSTSTRTDDEDRLVDLTIALESTLLFGVTEELKYRLALRGAALLSEGRDPGQTHAQLRALYDLRSKIVHEGKTLLELSATKEYKRHFEDLTPGAFVVRARELTRSVLRSMMREVVGGASAASIVSGFDARVISALTHVPPPAPPAPGGAGGAAPPAGGAADCALDL